MYLADVNSRAPRNTSSTASTTPASTSTDNLQVVIKVTLAMHTVAEVKNVPTITHQLADTLQKMGHTQQEQEDFSQFIVDEIVFRSAKCPTLMYEIMEYVEGSDLFSFCAETEMVVAGDAENSHSTQTPHTLTVHQLMTVFCNFIRAMKLYEKSGLLFSDLKLENVMVDPKTLVVTLVDYFDNSASGCDHYHCEKGDTNDVHTFEDEYNNTACQAGDVWRIALTILDAISMLVEKPKDPNKLPANVIRHKISANTYPEAQVFQITQRVIDKLMAKCKVQSGTNEHSYITELKELVLKMLNKDISSRPTMAEVATLPPFGVCNTQKHSLHHIRDTRKQGKQLIQRLRVAAAKLGALK